jgi:hypothetical protein
VGEAGTFPRRVRAYDVGVADDNERRRADAADRVSWNVLEVAHALGGLVVKHPQVLGGATLRYSSVGVTMASAKKSRCG